MLATKPSRAYHASPSAVGGPMPYSKLVLGLVLLSLAAAYGQQAPQPDYSGTWRLQADDSVKLVLEQKDSTIHMKEFKGTDTRADYSCNTMGKECEVKYEGHRAKVSFWFNG